MVDEKTIYFRNYRLLKMLKQKENPKSLLYTKVLNLQFPSPNGAKTENFEHKSRHANKE